MGKILSTVSIALFLLVSCIPDKTGQNYSIDAGLKIVPAKMLKVPAENANLPTVIEAGIPRVTKLGKPKITPLGKNVSDTVSPILLKSIEPVVCRPGEGQYSFPLVVSALDSTYQTKFPDVYPIPAAYHKPHNPHSFSFYTRLQGLQHDDLGSSVIDENGNLWFGTYGAGIIRFDGSNFAHFNVDHGLNGNHVLSMFKDSKGNIWVGTRNNGVSKYDGRNITVYTTTQGLNNNSIESIFEDSKGNMWFGYYEGGVSKFDSVYFTHYTTREGLAGDIVYTITEDFDGNMWFGTRGGGISMFDGEVFYNYNENQGLISDYIVSGLTDKEGNLWFGTDGAGIIKYNDGIFSYYNSSNGLRDTHVMSMLEDRSGNIWFGTRYSGLSRFDGFTFAHFGEQEGLLNHYVTTIIEDKSGNIRFGTFGGGIGLYQGNRFTHFSDEDGIKDSYIRAIEVDSKGNIWLSSNRHGLFLMNKEGITNITTREGLHDDILRDLKTDSSGRMWMGSSTSGFAVSDGDKFYNYTVNEGLPANEIITMLHDSKGNTWLGTMENGAVKFDGTYFTCYTDKEGLSSNHIRKIIEDRNGDIWFATRYGGLTRYDGENFYHLNEESGLVHNDIFDLIEDSDGFLWIGTNGRGLVRYDGENFIQLSERDGLVNKFIYSILEDKHKNIWVGTRLGISRLLKSNLKKQIDRTNNPDQHQDKTPLIIFKNYSQEDGFLGIGCNSRAIREDLNGVIWIGANDLLTNYHPEGDIPDTIPPNLKITGIGLFNEKLDWVSLINNQDTTIRLGNGMMMKGFSFNDIDTWYGIPHELRLNHNNNFITFSFSGINSNFSGKILYRFMLEGLEANWSSLSGRNEVSYGNLSPGNYSFRLSAVNSEGIWSDEVRYNFVINSPWWAGWRAFFVYSLVFLVSVVLVLWRVMKLKKVRELKRQKEILLEQEVAIARQSAEFKQNFLANMSHEIRTPLTGILGMAEVLSKTSLDESQKDYLNTLIQSGENLKETINLVLDYSKIEAGKLKINEQLFSFESLFKEAEKMYSALNRNNLTLEMAIDPDIPGFIVSDPRRISQIINNLLSNAFKFTEKGKIEIKASLERSHSRLSTDEKEDSIMIKIEIKDTGKGISDEDIKQLFKPFYQVEQTFDRSFDGTGLGLSICKELVEMLNGQIGVESMPGKGSKFWFTIKARTMRSSDHDFDQITDKQKETPQSLKILFVEDKVVNQKVITLMLKSLGHMVTLASNGEEALNIYAPDHFDLILMDIQMPVMDGITAIEKLKEKYKNLPPVVGLSANAFEGDREKYMQLGMDEYLTKPVKQEDFEKILIKLGFFN